MRISKLEPKEVFGYFNKITQIPRGSGNLDGICAFCMDFAREHGLKAVQDQAGNVIIYAPGTAGYENSETVILQGHLDMVCDCDPDCSLDMEHDALELDSDGEFLWADGTTLGADDGIAVAYILAILASDKIPHPPIEALFTVDEEVGMIGANNLDTSHLTGKKLINMDSEEEGVLTVSCAGGSRGRLTFDYDRKEDYSNLGIAYELKVSGLRGGHSGTDIHKNRKNAIKLLAEILGELGKKYDFTLAEIWGGVKDNAIPKEASAILCFNEKDGLIRFCEEIEMLVREIKTEMGESVVGLRVSFVPTDRIEKTTTKLQTMELVHFIQDLPDGVWKMSQHMEGKVETSLNLAVVKTTEDAVEFTYFLRSNVAGGKDDMKKKIERCLKSYHGTIEYYNEYGEWSYRENSPLRDTAIQAYRECFDAELALDSVHGGLELGILSGKMPDVDFISMGPTMYNVHTPNERLDIASAGRCWEFLKKILEDLK